MSRMGGAVTARLRLALAIVVGSAVALLMPSLFATTVDAPSAALLAVLAVALTAALGRNRLVAVPVTSALAPQPGTADEAPSFLAGRVTDPVHHPLRPRAPGLA
jgi:hypothetical protein